MIVGTLQQAADVLSAPLVGSDGRFRGVSTDTRTLQKDALFVALSGPNFDGAAFVEQAANGGAAGAVVARDVETDLPCIRVADGRAALATLARDWRDRFDGPVVGVTGSAGKTTVKEMLAAILARRGPVLATRGNLNNEIGVPLTLFRLDAEHRAAVVEMGANNPGEIATLAAIARPTVGIVTNAGPAHLEGFGSLEGVATSKGEMYGGLDDDGTAVINADDKFAPLWHELAAGHRVVTFGTHSRADIRLLHTSATADGAGLALRMMTPVGEIAVELALAGEHNALNAAGAAAAAFAAGATAADIVAGLAVVQGVGGRMALGHTRAGGRLIDDTYNANPRSVRVALQYLTGLDGRPWAVLGDMGELGSDAPSLHREVGEAARTLGVERLWLLGRLSRETAAGFGASARCFDDVDSLLDDLARDLEPDVNVLVKGSRSMRLERVTERLRGDGGGARC